MLIFFYLFFLSRRTQAFSVRRRKVWLEVAMGKTNKCAGSPCGSRAALINSIKCSSVPENKLFTCWRELVFLRKQGERSHFISRGISFRKDVFLIFFSLSLEAKLTSVIAEIAAETSWKINLRAFEIPEWIDWACPLWAHVYLFSNCWRDRGHVDSIGICFVFRYRHHEGALAAAAEK